MLGKYVKIAPSILSADFSRLGEQIDTVVEAGADYIHIDVMDGHFVPNITIGVPVLTAVRSRTEIPLDVHLMIEKPEDYIEQFIDAGADIITVHTEANRHLHRLISTVKDLGAKAGVALNPATPLCVLDEILPYLDLILLMTVNPGFGGQTFIPEMDDKIVRLRNSINANKYEIELEVDGGITAEIVPRIVKAGADVLVAGAAIFTSDNPGEAIKQLRQAINLAC